MFTKFDAYKACSESYTELYGFPPHPIDVRIEKDRKIFACSDLSLNAGRKPRAAYSIRSAQSDCAGYASKILIFHCKKALSFFTFRANSDSSSFVGRSFAVWHNNSASGPKWRNGRRRGFKIPRLHGRESSSLSLGTT